MNNKTIQLLNKRAFVLLAQFRQNQIRWDGSDLLKFETDEQLAEATVALTELSAIYKSVNRFGKRNQVRVKHQESLFTIESTTEAISVRYTYSLNVEKEVFKIRNGVIYFCCPTIRYNQNGYAYDDVRQVISMIDRLISALPKIRRRMYLTHAV